MFFCLFCQFRQNLNFLRLWFNLCSNSRDDSKFSKFRFSHFLHKSSPLLKSTDYKVNLYKCPLAVAATVHRNYDCRNPFSDLSFLFWGVHCTPAGLHACGCSGIYFDFHFHFKIRFITAFLRLVVVVSWEDDCRILFWIRFAPKSFNGTENCSLLKRNWR